MKWAGLVGSALAFGLTGLALIAEVGPGDYVAGVVGGALVIAGLVMAAIAAELWIRGRT